MKIRSEETCFQRDLEFLKKLIKKNVEKDYQKLKLVSKI